MLSIRCDKDRRQVPPFLTTTSPCQSTPGTSRMAARLGQAAWGLWRVCPAPAGSRPCGRLGGMTIAEVMAAYARAWNTGNAGERAQQLTDSFLRDAVFVAPQGTTSGTAGLSDGIGEFRARSRPQR